QQDEKYEKRLCQKYVDGGKSGKGYNGNDKSHHHRPCCMGEEELQNLYIGYCCANQIARAPAGKLCWSEGLYRPEKLVPQADQNAESSHMGEIWSQIAEGSPGQ